MNTPTVNERLISLKTQTLLVILGLSLVALGHWLHPGGHYGQNTTASSAIAHFWAFWLLLIPLITLIITITQVIWKACMWSLGWVLWFTQSKHN
jgi:hypothetical protein